VDFSSWQFSNDPRYVAGALRGQRVLDFGLEYGLWVVEWVSNTWTRITPAGLDVVVDDPALFISDPLTAASAAAAPRSALRPETRVCPVIAGTADAAPLPAQGATFYSLQGNRLDTLALAGRPGISGVFVLRIAGEAVSGR